MSHQSRQPAGVPTGGQFSAAARAESGVHLDHPDVTLDVGQVRELRAALDGHLQAISDDAARSNADGHWPVRWPEGASEAYTATAMLRQRVAEDQSTDLPLTERQRTIALDALEGQQRRVITEASQEARRSAQTSGHAGTWSPAARESLDTLRAVEEKIATTPAVTAPDNGSGGPVSRSAGPDKVPTILPSRSPFADLHTESAVQEQFHYLTEPEILYCDGERSADEARAEEKRLRTEASQRITELTHWQRR